MPTDFDVKLQMYYKYKYISM